jgi:3D (Asp-Asp-Asp) domain-containing protein
VVALRFTALAISLVTTAGVSAPVSNEYVALDPPYPPYVSYLEPAPKPAPVVVPVTVQKPELRITKLSGVRVTACSPQDPADLAYYAKHGYEGATYGVAADLRQLPRGTLIRVPGYRGGSWHVVDSAGGSVIRRSTRNGITQIDVKYRTLHSARKWGSKTLDIEVIYPKHFNEASAQLDVR